MMNLKSTTLLLAIASCLSAKGATKIMLDAVATIESSNNPRAVGDSGRALGKYQFHEIAWNQVTKMREEKGLQTFIYRTRAMNQYIAEIYANDYLDWIDTNLSKHLGRQALPWEVYAAYNQGLSAFIKMNCDFNALPSHTQKACLHIAQLTQSSIPKR